MSKTGEQDNRARGDLQAFVIAMIDRGLKTPYELKAKAGLSPGATLPVLSRLGADGYVKRGKTGARGKTEYLVTSAGRQFAKEVSDELIAFPPKSNPESVLRIAALAVILGTDKKTVAGYLRKSARATAEIAEDRWKHKAAELPANRDELYGWMRAVYVNETLKAEAKASRTLASRIRKLKFK